MAKVLRMMVSVAADKLADALDALDGLTESVVVKTDRPSDTETETAEELDMIGGASERQVRPRAVKRQPTVAVKHSPQPRTRLAGKVIYTPAGTKRQLDAMLAELRGQQSMRAMVLRDLVKHPGSSNAEMRERLAASAKKAGLSIESIDNVIWMMVNKGQINKQSAEA